MTTTTIGMTDEMQIVLALAVHGEGLFSNCISISGRSDTIDRMVEVGYLMRRPHGYVRVTDAGRAAYRGCA